MSEANVIREFLVSLGFKVNTAGKKEFESTVVDLTVKVVKLGAATAATAAAVVVGVAKIADNLERLYFASKRTNATVENIQAIGYALNNMGSDAEAGLASIESIARLLRTSPGGEGLLKNIGINTRDASGGLRDTVDMLGDLGKKFAGMPYYRANAYAQALGIDEKTLMALREGVGQFSDEYRDMLRQAGIDSQDAAKKSHEFMIEVRGLMTVLGLMGQRIASGLMERAGGAVERFRRGFLANFAKIEDVLIRAAVLVFKVGDALGHMVVRGMQVLGYLIDRFNGLSDGSQAVIKWLGLILIAWKVLNTGFLSSPLGRIVALISALALLWDDFQVWKEGGKSLIDWSLWAPGIEKAIEYIKIIGGAIHESLGFLGDWRGAFEILLAYVATTWVAGMLSSIAKVSIAATGATAGLISKVVPVAAAGVTGYAAGSFLYDNYLAGTKTADMIGSGINSALNLFGLGYTPEPYKGAASSPRTPVAPTGNQPRGIRNNNPGNIEYGPFARSQGAIGTEPAGRFAMFADAQQGLNAIATLLRGKAYAGSGIDSVGGVISKYAPSKDNNDTAAYIKNVAGKLGVEPNAHLNLTDPRIMAGMVDAIVRVENGKNPYSRDMLDKAAGGPSVEIKQDVNITVSGKDEARQVERAQDNVNDKLMRNLRGAVR